MSRETSELLSPQCNCIAKLIATVILLRLQYCCWYC